MFWTITDLIDTVASSRIFLFWASLEQCQDDTQQPWIYLEKLTWVMNKTPGCLGYIWYIGDEKLTSYVGITIKHYKDPYETTSISVFNGKYPARFFFCGSKYPLKPWGANDSHFGGYFFFQIEVEVTFFFVCTLLVANISHQKSLLSRWFSFSPGGIC